VVEHESAEGLERMAHETSGNEVEGNSPEAAFLVAQRALESGDWPTFFRQFDRRDLLRIANNGVKLAYNARADDAQLSEIFARYSLPVTRLTSAWEARDFPEFERELKSALRRVADLALLTAALEQYTRARVGGGSVSSSLFAGERLVGLEVAGELAWGTRVDHRGNEQEIGFERKGGVWCIRLFARRRR
jgi:hypothetical protein